MGDYRAAPTAGAYQTTVQLLRVPLRIDDENQMYFANQTAQNNYFQSVIWKSLPSQTYQRENAYFRVDDDYDAIVTNCNYLRYRNAITGNKWFYAYITEFEYKNPNTTFVHFKIDAYQTYLFDITWKDCFIEREHVKDDSMGKHYLPDLKMGDKVIKYNSNIPLSTNRTGSIDLVPVVLLTDFPRSGAITGYKDSMNGVVQDMFFWTSTEVVNDTIDYRNVTTQFGAMLSAMSAKGKIDNVVGAFYVPRFKLENSDIFEMFDDYASATVGGIIQPSQTGSFALRASETTIDVDFLKLSFGGYIPKNNKLYTSQYNSILFTNNNGATMELKPEMLVYDNDTNRWTVQMTLKSSVSPDAVAYLCVDKVGKNGRYQSAYDYYKLPLGNFPVPSISGDYFTTFLNSRSTQIVGNIATSAAQIGLGVSMLGLPGGQYMATGTMLSGLSSITSTVASAADAANIADPARVQATSTSAYASGYAKFSAYVQQITYSEAKQIDKYFTMFGYKVNELKVPEFATRQYYNYYKMPVCNITGNIPQSALDEIRSKFERGITLWNTSDVGNYRDGNNPIVTS